MLSSAAGIVPGPSVLVVARPAQAAIAAARLRREPSIAVVQPRAAVSPDGRFVLVTASFHAGTGDHPAVAKRLAATLPGEVGGTAVANEEVRTQTEHDLLRAELIAFPLLFLLALWVFRGVVAAALPLLAGGLSIVITLALIRVINDVTPISVFALNLVTGAGLGLAIDYSLLLRLALPRGARPARSRDRGAARDAQDRRAHGRLQRGHGRRCLRVAARVPARFPPLDGPGRVDHRAARRGSSH